MSPGALPGPDLLRVILACFVGGARGARQGWRGGTGECHRDSPPY